MSEERRVPTYSFTPVTLNGNDQIVPGGGQPPPAAAAARPRRLVHPPPEYSDDDEELDYYEREARLNPVDNRTGRRTRRVGEPGPPIPRSGPPANLRALMQNAPVRNRTIPIIPPIPIQVVADYNENDTPVVVNSTLSALLLPDGKTGADYYLKPYADVQKRKLGQVALDVAKCVKCSRIHYKKMFCCSLISQHIMCYECFNKPRLDAQLHWRSFCEYCQQNVYVREFDFRVMKFTELRCEYFDHGCTEVLSEAKFGEHVKSCSKNPNTA